MPYARPKIVSNQRGDADTDPPASSGPIAPRPRRARECFSEPVELAEFAAALEELRQQSRTTHEALHKKTGYCKSVLSKAASGVERPTLDVVRKFVEACGGDVQDFTRRWHIMNEAVDRHRQELLALVDLPFEQMRCPSSPARYNRQLQLRICRNKAKQVAVAHRANYQPSTASGFFKANRLAHAEFVERMLTAAEAPRAEITVWLAWRSQLAEQLRGAAPQAKPVRPQRRPRKVLGVVSVAASVTFALFLALSGSAPSNTTVAAAPTLPAVAAPDRQPPAPAGQAADEHRSGQPTAPVVAGRGGVAVASPQPSAATGTSRTWKAVAATIIGSESPIPGKQADKGGATPKSGDVVNVVCITTTTDPIGWYYTDRRYYINPASLRFAANDRNRVPGCNEIPFAETRWARPDPAMLCLVRLQLQSCGLAGKILGDAVR